ncbi:Nif3-like dinuclear metal center hexameric protein [Mycoplasmopsis canis]|uniref:Nif3-like dinuclear metal center hexameric protein n=1 Tax=Mycoplasmopsis canis TaxID=29555 RepID=UPI00025AFC37|nr:Nif3-like dinuclear metal center hexameric protein [Mycoplasmopsis canis]AKF40924.1 hypothetical protein AAW50_00475 [Mycoplasmopsis canis]EIE40330.1 hypothetical protein MCANUF33_02441 [Mycoplasmopsis canis UF33]
MTVKTFIENLKKLYPENNAEIWDYTGYNVKSQQNKKFSGAILAIDLTKEVLEEAIKRKFNVILTHHPFIFNKTWKEEFAQAPYKREIYKKLKEHQITSYSLHTNFDYDLHGTSYQIFNFLGLDKKLLSNNSPTYSVVFENDPRINLISLIEEKFGYSNALRLNFNDQELSKFKKIAILSGSGSVLQINEMHSGINIDLFITSDIKWNEWINYNQTGIKILEIPHLSEDVFAWSLLQKLKDIYPSENFYFKKIQLPFINKK